MGAQNNCKVHPVDLIQDGLTVFANSRVVVMQCSINIAAAAAACFVLC